MNNATLVLLCCGALLTACDNSNDTTSQREASKFDDASSQATNGDTANDQIEATTNSFDNTIDSAQDTTNNLMNSAEESADNAMDTVDQAAEDTATAGRELKDSAVDTVESASAATAKKYDEAVASIGSGDDEGEATYKKYCVACHGTGVAGAPKLGDKAAWSARIATGNATLTKHAIEGFQGKSGYMPPKGGFMNLSDDEIATTVEYMVSQSK